MINVKNQNPNPTFSRKEIIGSHGWRGKWWRHAQIERFISNDETQSTSANKDPNFWLTQSGKNYQHVKKGIRNYSDPKQWQLAETSIGVGWKQHPISSLDQVFQNYRSDQWHRAASFAYLFYKLPGVEKVYVLGSVPLDISTEKSDIDFAIQTSPYAPLISRFWIKVFLKVKRVDVHPLWLSFSGKDNEAKRSAMWRHKQNRSGIDVGLIYQKESDIRSFYGLDVRHMWLHIKTLIIRRPRDANTEEAVYLWKLKPVLIDTLCQLSLWLVSIPLLPFIFAQLLLHDSDTINHHIRPNFINYYPRYPEQEMLTLLDNSSDGN